MKDYLEMLGFVFGAIVAGGAFILIQGGVMYFLGNWLERKVGTWLTVVLMIVAVTCEVTAIVKKIGMWR